jgi:hypothetical protein
MAAVRQKFHLARRSNLPSHLCCHCEKKENQWSIPMKLGLAQAVILCVAIGGLIQIAKLGDGVRSAPERDPQ